MRGTDNLSRAITPIKIQRIGARRLENYLYKLQFIMHLFSKKVTKLLS